MNLTAMRTQVRKDLRDETTPYRWSDAELDQHIAHAVRDYSKISPRDYLVIIATTPGSREIDISEMVDIIQIYHVEFPHGEFPPSYQPYYLKYPDTLVLAGDTVGDGSNCYIYYGTIHALDDYSSTIPIKDDLTVSLGAQAYALSEYAAYSIDRVPTGRNETPEDFRVRAEELFARFQLELKRLKSRLRSRKVYTPDITPSSKRTDWGP